MSTSLPFIPLRVHTAYSLLEGAIPVKKLIGLAKKFNMPAVALTDTNNLFGAFEFSKEAKMAGIQPLLGCQLQVKMPAERSDLSHPLVFLVQNQQGYENLLKIVTYANLQGTLTFEILAPFTAGLIALTGGVQGGLAQQVAKGIDGTSTVKALQDLFQDRLYIEISRQGHQTDQDLRMEEALIDLAYAHHVPLVATNEAFFPDAPFYEAHDALLCIAGGTYVSEDKRNRLTPDHCFKSPEEMASLFADLPEALLNTQVIAKRCSFLLEPIDPILPSFPCEEGEEVELRNQAHAGLADKLIRHVFTPDMGETEKEEVRHTYTKQLEYELGVIQGMNFSGYFLIVADFIKWAKGNGIPVGPGRGSGAGSVVAWSLTITDLDPLKFGLVFERFLNPERVSMPDFDIDFCQERRDEVIRYVQKKYGADRVAHIITFGKLQARAVLRDVGRVLQMPYTQVDRICKLIPNNPANPVTLEQALEVEPQLKEMVEKESEVERLMLIARQLEGLYRHASTHAAGVVIGNRPLNEMVPLYQDPGSALPATQYNMKYVESAGLVKFDFLGLTTLTVIQQAVTYLKEQGIFLNLSNLPLDDVKTYEILRRAETIGIFQIESSGMTDLTRKLKPTQFEDIIAIGALYRPGPMDNIPRFVACHHGNEKPTYIYPELEAIVGNTHGIMVYQEQVMKIARDMAGYTMGGADLLRKAMGKKIKSEMQEQRKRFIDGVIKHTGGTQGMAKELFAQIEKFASYAFPRAHAAAYALITYQTAYLKAHHPVEYMAALMTNALNNTDKLTLFARETLRLGIDLLPPDVNESGALFRVHKGKIRYALAALKNVGVGAMEAVMAERTLKGPFKNIFDFVERMKGKTINKRQMEHLIMAGAFDSLSSNRRQLFDNLELLMRYGNEDVRAPGLFGADVTRPKLTAVADWPALVKLRHEFSAVGFYLTAHPLDVYTATLTNIPIQSSVDVLAQTHADQNVRLAGIVLSKQERVAKSGQRYAFLSLSDASGVFEVTLFSETLSQYRNMVVPGSALLLTVSTQFSKDSLRLTCQSMESLEEILEGEPLTVRVETQDQARILIRLLKDAPPGSTRVRVEVKMGEEIAAILALQSSYKVSSEVRAELGGFMELGRSPLP